MSVNLVLAGVLALLQLADVWTTIAVIRRCGREGNRALVWLAARLPGRWTWLVVSKLLVCCLAWWMARQGGVLATAVLGGLAALYAFVVWHNWLVLRNQ